MATALAASITRSTSPCTTSLSLMATMPCELRLRTWLPAMPAYTEWISQPAINSASSTARWMDCTVDSILTTTPFFRPREGWLPMPMISSAPSVLISPTMATTLLVPMSRPTNRFRSERFAMYRCSLDVGIVGMFGRHRCRDRGIAPADGEPIGVAHVDVGNFIHSMRNDLRCGVDEAVDAFADFAPSQAHRHPAVDIHLPRAALVEAQRRNAHARLEHPPLDRQVALRDLGLRALGAAQAGQFRGDMRRRSYEEFAARIQETRLAPARGGGLLDHGHMHAVGPAALNASAPNPQTHTATNAPRRMGRRHSIPRPSHFHCGFSSLGLFLNRLRRRSQFRFICAPAGSWFPERATPARRSRCRLDVPPWAPGCDRSCPESC